MALICALAVTALLTVVGGALVLLLTTETLITAHYRAGQDAFYAADAGVERVIAELRTVADWADVLASSCTGGAAAVLCDPTAPRTADGQAVNIAALTTARQSQSDGRYGSGANAPRWQVFAHASVDRLLSLEPRPAPAYVPPPMYVIVWLADDADDPDSDPMHDTNGVLMLRAEAFGAGGTRRGVEAIVARGPVDVRLLNWRQVR
jgi:type IV pilus assembly PilX-like protein